MNSYIVEDLNGYKLVKCCMTNINSKVFKVEEKILEKLKKNENPY